MPTPAKMQCAGSQITHAQDGDAEAQSRIGRLSARSPCAGGVGNFTALFQVCCTYPPIPLRNPAKIDKESVVRILAWTACCLLSLCLRQPTAKPTCLVDFICRIRISKEIYVVNGLATSVQQQAAWPKATAGLPMSKGLRAPLD